MFEYKVTGIAWIPSYGDTDQFFTTIIANSVEEMEDQLYSRYPYVKGYHIEETTELTE